MSDKRISELTAAGALTGAETLPLVQAAATKRTTLQLIADWVVGSAISFTQPGAAPSTGWASRTVRAKNSEVVSVKDAKVTGGAAVAGDGVQDDSSAINAIFAAGYKSVLVPYTSAGYKIGSTISFTANDQQLQFEPGAFFTFTGTGPCIDIGTSGTLQRCLVENATINVAAGQTGIRIFRSLRCGLIRCLVKLTATGIGYDLDGNTLQNYYNYIEDCEVDNTNHTPPYTGTGIHLRNEANHNQIIRGVIQWVDTGIQMAKTGGTSVSGNLVQSTIVGNFQTYGVNFPASASGTGNSFINNWFENIPTTGTGINIADTSVVSTFLLGNNYSGLTTNLNDLSDNTANRQTMQLDVDRQRIGNLLLEFTSGTGRIRAQRWARASPSDQNLDIVGNGLNIYGAQDLTNAGLAIAGSGNTQMKTKGLCGSNTKANNLRGQVTFASAATAAVTFSVAETNNAYFISVSGSVNETFWVTAKGTGGFTLNSSNASSTAVVDWHLIR
jgi:hypothetical protein